MNILHPDISRARAFDETSHFVVTGTAEFQELTVDCEFEVVYTHNCEIIIALYVERDTSLELFMQDHS